MKHFQVKTTKYSILLLFLILISCNSNDSNFLLHKWKILGIERLDKANENDKDMKFKMAYLNKVFSLKTYEFFEDNKYQAIIKDMKIVNGTFEYNKNDKSLVLKANNKKEEFIVQHFTDSTLLLQFVTEPLLMKLKVSEK